MQAIIITQRNEIIFTEHLDSFSLDECLALNDKLAELQITAEYLNSEGDKVRNIASYLPGYEISTRKTYEEIAKEVIETALAGDDYVAIINLGTINTNDYGLAVRPYTLSNR